MSEFKGTPGPWVVEENPCVKLGLQVASFSEYGNRTLQVVVYSNHPEDDSRLIAAAPKLLEALSSMVDLYETDEGCQDLDQYRKARAAIAKALGEDSDQ